ncbi:hypothetical protein GY45DRAFT_779629 [Cubamyces sp. BRFM 1775]|nr:hypothetical protein GY45DRAFT_779629 [Cubamyces sp. BRFM 1775]
MRQLLLTFSTASLRAGIRWRHLNTRGVCRGWRKGFVEGGDAKERGQVGHSFPFPTKDSATRRNTKHQTSGMVVCHLRRLHSSSTMMELWKIG